MPSLGSYFHNKYLETEDDMENTILKQKLSEQELRDLIAEHYKEWGEVFGNVQKAMLETAQAWSSGDLAAIAITEMKLGIFTNHLEQMDLKRWKVPVFKAQWLELREKELNKPPEPKV